MKIYYIWWSDSQSENGWQTRDEINDSIKELTPTITIGFLVTENAEYIYLASTFDKDTDSFNCAICIPKKSISKMESFNFIYKV